MTPDQVLDLLRREEALLEGHFLLSSGLRSDSYFQCALALRDPKNAEKLGQALAAKFTQSFDLVAGPALGAVIWAHEMARALGLGSIFTERDGGKMALRRGFKVNPGQRVLVVEDVVTTGGSAREVVTLLCELGAKPTHVGCIVDRTGGANPFADLGLELTSLVKATVRTWKAEEAPVEFKDSTPIKPGSRPGAAVR